MSVLPLHLMTFSMMRWIQQDPNFVEIREDEESSDDSFNGKYLISLCTIVMQPFTFVEHDCNFKELLALPLLEKKANKNKVRANHF